MADLEALAKQMSEMAKQMGGLAISSQAAAEVSARIEQKQEAMQQKIDAQQMRIDSSTVLAAGAPLQLASRGDWLIPTSELLTAPDQEDALVSQKQVLAQCYLIRLRIVRISICPKTAADQIAWGVGYMA